MAKLLTTILTVLVAVIASAGLWTIANLVFNQVERNWSRYKLLTGAVGGFVLGALIAGNRVTVGSEGNFFNWVWLPLLLAVCVGGGAALLPNLSDQRSRLLGAAGIGAAIALLITLLTRTAYQPALDWLALVLWTIGAAAVGAGLAIVLRRPVVPVAALIAALGALVGGWGAAEIGAGGFAETLVATAVPLVLVGARAGWRGRPDETEVLDIERRARAGVFLAPAVIFIAIMLLIPTLRTIYLSFLDARSEKLVGFYNYWWVFQRPDTWNLSKIGNFWGSRLLWIGAVLLLVSLVLGLVARQRTGRAVEIGNPTFLPLVCGTLFVAFALFSVWRGTIANNIWWVVSVSVFSTTLGLAIAVLADNRKLERTAKSVIFMPMAISMVGASVIWRFMYTSRDATQNQTGVMNALWVGLGRLSTGSGIPTYVIGVLLIAACIALLVAVARALVGQRWGAAAMPGVLVILLGWFTLRYWAVWGGGVGGFRIRDDGRIQAQAVEFIQNQPFNNMWLQVVLIWIQTGFAMIILSAAIKAVPTEFIEAAQLDGATPTQIFWKVTLPSIATTIGVVVTTLIVTVMKVYDIVKVMTNGNFGTQVLANDMANTAFQNRNYGGGAALAVLLFLAVLPVMIVNIRRMQKEG